METGHIFALEFHNRDLAPGWGVLTLAILLCIGMAVLDVRKPVFPAPVEDSDPFVCESADGRVVFLAARKLALVVRPRPCRFQDGVKGPFVKCLAQKSRIRLTAMRHSCIPALFDDGGDP